MSESAPAGTAGNIEEQKIFAALSWWFILGPIFLFAMKDKPFIRHHAAQGTVLLILGFALCLFSCVLTMIPFIGLIFGIFAPVIGLGWIVVSIFGTIKAVGGEWWKCPIIGEWAKKIPV